MKQENITKTIALVGFILIIVALIAAWNSPATGFESSIYSSTPLSFWLCLLLGIGFGIFIIIYQIYQQNFKNNLWILGLLLILIGNTVALSLPVIRGYYLWNGSGDAGYHIGTIQNLLITGHIEKNAYPFIHIYIAQISEILGIGVIPIVSRITIFFGILYMVFLYLAARALLPRKEQILLTCLAGAALIHGWFNTVSPNGLGNLLFPLILFLLIKSSSSSSFSWRILFIIIIILIPLIHPLIAFISLIMLISLRIIAGIMYSKARHSVTTNEFVSIKPAWGTILLLLFWAATWISISSSFIWGDIIRNVSEALRGASPNQIQSLVNNINYAAEYGYSIINYFTKIYLITAIYGIIALVAFPILIKKNAHEPKLKMITAFYSPLVVISLIMIFFYFLNLPMAPGRMEIYIIIMLFFMMGFPLFEFIRWSRTRKRALSLISIVLVGLFLFGASFSGMAKLYPSPYTYDVSSQNTHSEISGMDWFLKQKDITIYSAGWYFAPYRYAEFLLTTEEKQTRNDLSLYVTKDLPFHLGYDLYTNLGNYFNTDVYIILRDLNRKVYTEIYPEMANIRLLPDDFNKLEQDSTVNKLYENGGFEVYYTSITK